MEKVYYKEEQRFNQAWVFIILILTALGSTVPFLVGIYVQEVLHRPWGNNPVKTGLLVFFFIFHFIIMGGLILLFIKMRLIVEIRKDAVCYQYPPIINKWRAIRKEDIKDFEVRKYKPVREFGGWGIKSGSKKKAYTVSGNIGLQLYIKNGRKILFGTRRKQAIEYAMEKLMSLQE